MLVETRSQLNRNKGCQRPKTKDVFRCFRKVACSGFFAAASSFTFCSAQACYVDLDQGFAATEIAQPKNEGAPACVARHEALRLGGFGGVAGGGADVALGVKVYLVVFGSQPYDLCSEVIEMKVFALALTVCVAAVRGIDSENHNTGPVTGVVVSGIPHDSTAVARNPQVFSMNPTANNKVVLGSSPTCVKLSEKYIFGLLVMDEHSAGAKSFTTSFELDVNRVLTATSAFYYNDETGSATTGSATSKVSEGQSVMISPSHSVWLNLTFHKTC
jgi:hypothetical protein